MLATRVRPAKIGRQCPPTCCTRGIQSKTRRTSPTISRTSPSPRQAAPKSELQKFQERMRAESAAASPRKSSHGIPPRALTFLGITALVISTYTSYLYASYKREVSKAQSLDVPTDVSDRYNSTARTFDAEVELSERVMRMGSKRADLVRMARGDVLEVSCGTGRNLEYYELGERRGVDTEGKSTVRGCRSLTMIDLSPQMVSIAEDKFRRLRPEFTRVLFRAQDAATVTVEKPTFPSGAESTSTRQSALGRPTRQDGYYDTIVQTMGLCSMPDPAATLRHLGSITEPERGRILLLEHGRSHYDWLNRILDNLAPSHADRHGCWWNRDIGAIVKESGLEVVEEKRWHFGTTWKYVLRPRQHSAREAKKE